VKKALPNKSVTGTSRTDQSANPPLENEATNNEHYIQPTGAVEIQPDSARCTCKDDRDNNDACCTAVKCHCEIQINYLNHQVAALQRLHWLEINERIKYKVLSLTYKSFKTGQPSYLRSLLSFPSHRCTRSSFLITLSRPSLTFRLKTENRSFYHSAPVL